MRQYTTVAIDLAKRSFQLCLADDQGKVVSNAKYTQSKFEAFIGNCQAKHVVFEACATAHHWGRHLTSLGFEVTLLDPAYVSSFVRRQKNDKNDAKAILHAFLSPDPVTVPIKTVEQQELQLLIRTRQGYVEDKVALANRLRAILSEFGIVLAKSMTVLHQYLHEYLYGMPRDGYSDTRYQLLDSNYQQLLTLESQIKNIDKLIDGAIKNNAVCQHLMQVPGIGKIIATALYASVGDAQQFKNGRHLSAYLGLVPKQHSSGETTRLLGIHKAGNVYLRSLLIQGAQSVLLHASKSKTLMHKKVLRLSARHKHRNVIVVAIANTMARWAYSAIRKGRDFTIEGCPK